MQIMKTKIILLQTSKQQTNLIHKAFWFVTLLLFLLFSFSQLD